MASTYMGMAHIVVMRDNFGSLITCYKSPYIGVSITTRLSANNLYCFRHTLKYFRPLSTFFLFWWCLLMIRHIEETVYDLDNEVIEDRVSIFEFK